MAIWGAFLIANHLDLPQISFYGDSKLVVDGIMGKITLSNPGIQGWLKRAKILWTILNHPPIKHIYRENNSRADDLSKKGIQVEFGIIRMLHYRNGSLIWQNTIPLP